MAVLRNHDGLPGRLKPRTAAADIVHRAAQKAYAKTGGATPALREVVAMYRARTVASDK